MKINKIKENGEVFAPATITDAVGFPEMNVSLTKILSSYNLTALYGGNFSFESGLNKLNSVLPDNKKLPGVVMGFTNSSGTYEEWMFNGNGYEFTNPIGWVQNDCNTLLELQKAVFPISVYLSASANSIEVGKTTDVRFVWNIARKGVSVTEQAINTFDGTVTQGGYTILTLSPTEHGSKTYTYTGYYAGMTASVKTTVTYNHQSYYGKVSSTTTSITDPSTLSGKTLLSGKGFTWSGINMNFQKIAYAYPAYFGALSDVRDGNNFSTLGSYTMSSITFNGTNYYVYIFTNPTTVTGFKQIFS